MSTIGSYKNTQFSESQKFLVLDPSTGTTSLVPGSSLVDYITPNLGYVYAESTRLAAENTDYAVGSIIQTSGSTSVGDDFAATYLVVGAGEGDFPMLNGNELLVIKGDEFLREQLAEDPSVDGNGVLLVNGAVQRVSSRTEMKAYDVGAGYQFSLEEGGRSGLFVVKSGTPPSDPQEGIYVVLDNGNYAMRRYDGITEKAGISCEWFGAIGDGATDDTLSIQASWDYANSIDRTAYLGEGTFNFTSLTWPSSNNRGGRLVGSGRYSTALIATDPLVGYAIARADDNANHFYGEVGGMFLGTSISGLSAAQDDNQDLWGLLALGCNFAKIHDVAFGGFGKAGLVLGQAENGAEGFGFSATSKGGNHTYLENINMTGCGRYNTGYAQSAITAPWKWNASTATQIQSNSIEGSSFFLKYGANNRVFGFTAEAGGTGFHFGERATGNTVQGIYGEILTNLIESDPRADINSVRSNYVFGGGGAFDTIYKDNGDPRVLVFGESSVIGVTEERPTATGSREDRGYWQMRGLRNNPDGWVEIKANGWGDSAEGTPKLKFWDSRVTTTIGNPYGGEIVFENRHSADNESAKIYPKYLGGGLTSITLQTGDPLADTLEVYKTYIRPSADNATDLGGASNRFKEIFAANGTINTSDEREKEQVRELSETEKRVAVALKAKLKAFKWKDAVEKKGDGARWHFGVIAQEVVQAFLDQGLDAHDYGMICYDEWDGGDRYGVRYDELMAFIVSAI